MRYPSVTYALRPKGGRSFAERAARCVMFGVGMAVLLFGLNASFAEEVTWKSAGSNDWTSAKNWSSGQVPAGGELVVFDQSSEDWAGSPQSRVLTAGAVLARGERTKPTLIQPFKDSSPAPRLVLHGYKGQGSGESALITNVSTQLLVVTNRSEDASFPVVLEASGVIQAESPITIGSPIEGEHGLTKRGKGLLLLGDAFTPSATTNGRAGSTFSGGFTIEEGDVATYWSSGYFKGGLTTSPFGGGALTLRGGTLRSTSGNPRTYLNSVKLDGDFTFGSDASSNGPIWFGTKAGGATTLERDVTLNVINITTWEQSITGDHRIVKDGKGMLVLNGDVTVKEIVVKKGSLRVTGTLTCEKLEVLAEGALCGQGKINCDNVINPTADQESEFTFTHNGKKLIALVHRPKNYKDGSLLVLLHGATRDGAGYRKSASYLADRLGMLLVVPEYDRERFDPAAYQEGGVLRDGKLVDKEEWTFASIKPLVEEMSKREGRALPYYLVGHSGGAQFLDRMAAMWPDDAERIVAVNPGSLIFPTRDMPYPYGFGGLPEEMGGDEAIKHYLAAPLTLYLGTGDVTTEALPMEDLAMKQGQTRIERGRKCFEMGKALAESRGWPFHWTIVEAEGLGHGSLPMWKHDLVEKAVLGR